MFSSQSRTLKLFLGGILATALCLQGCYKKEPVLAAENTARDEPVEPAPEKAEYANDLDRLEQLTERINRACRGSYTVVLGTDEPGGGGGLVRIDYALFDRLSDDGAAVLIAEAIATKSKPPSFSQIKPQAETEGAVLQVDEAVGRYIARAGFNQAGFAEWLGAKNLSTMGLKQNSVPEKMRITAFMRGYASESIVREDRLTRTYINRRL